jgi:hypothetical protein
MDDGLDLTFPGPVNVRRNAVTGMVTRALMVGSGMYIDGAAGGTAYGFDQVHASPPLPFPMRSAIVPAARDAQMTELYQMGPGYLRQRLVQKFGPLPAPARPAIGG